MTELVIGSLFNWLPDQFALHIWVENEEVFIACLRNVGLVLPITFHIKLMMMTSNVRAHVDHTHVAGRNLRPDHWLKFRKPSIQACRVIIVLAAYVAMRLSLPYRVRWPLTFQKGQFTFWHVLILTILVVSLNSSSENRLQDYFSRRRTDQD